jgi:hypothetical protein
MRHFKLLYDETSLAFSPYHHGKYYTYFPALHLLEECLKLNRRKAPRITSGEGAGSAARDLLTSPVAKESNDRAEVMV